MPSPYTSTSGPTYRYDDFQTIIHNVINAVKNDKVKLYIPELKGLRKMIPGTHFHLTPEIFIQLEGATKFSVPNGEFTLNPTDVCIMPRTVPHGEIVLPNKNEYRNVVIMYNTNRFHCHYSEYSKVTTQPLAGSRRSYESQEIPNALRIIEDCIKYFHEANSYKLPIVKNLLCAHLSILIEASLQSQVDRVNLSKKVSLCMEMVMTNLAHPDLNVKFLAHQLKCSADYLSNRFQKETGKSLIKYIHGRRIEHSQELLKDTTLNISEISWACGFSDPGYFIRIFKRQLGNTPKQYRKLTSKNNIETEDTKESA